MRESGCVIKGRERKWAKVAVSKKEDSKQNTGSLQKLDAHQQSQSVGYRTPVPTCDWLAPTDWLESAGAMGATRDRFRREFDVKLNLFGKDSIFHIGILDELTHISTNNKTKTGLTAKLNIHVPAQLQRECGKYSSIWLLVFKEFMKRYCDQAIVGRHIEAAYKEVSEKRK